MSHHPAFIYPPPPPPPPKASVPNQAYSSRPDGPTLGHGVRGGFNGGYGGRGWSGGGRGSHHGHHTAAWGNSLVSAKPSVGYGQSANATYPANMIATTPLAHQIMSFLPPGGAQTQSSQANAAQGAQGAQAPSPGSAGPWFNGPHSMPQFHTPNMASASVASGNGVSPYSSYSARHASSPQGWPPMAGQIQPTTPSHHPQMMASSIQMGFGHGQSSNHAHIPTNGSRYPLGTFPTSNARNFQATNVHSYSNENQQTSTNSHLRNRGTPPGRFASNARKHGGPQYSPRSVPRNSRDNDRPSSAAPAVPSSCPSSLPPKPVEQTAASSSTTDHKRKKRKQNALGLTPRTEERAESEEGIDEEMILGKKVAAEGNELRIEYRGTVSTLTTPAELATWIAQRKARFPTRQRIQDKLDARQLHLQEARRRREEDQRKREEVAKAKKAQAGSQAMTNTAAVPEEDSQKALKKRAKIIKKMKRNEKRLAELDAKIADSAESKTKLDTPDGLKRKQSEAENDAGEADVPHEERLFINSTDDDTKVVVIKHEEQDGVVDDTSTSIRNQEATPDLSHQATTTDAVEHRENSASYQSHKPVTFSSDPYRDSEDSSTSSLSDSSSTNASGDNNKPREEPIRENSTQHTPSSESEKAAICRQFLNTGRCSRQKGPNRCRFRHELTMRGGRQVQQPRQQNHQQQQVRQVPQPGGGGLGGGKGGNKKVYKERHRRKSLYQRMVEVEQHKEDLFVLEAIKYLGEQGILDEEPALNPITPSATVGAATNTTNVANGNEISPAPFPSSTF